MDDYICQRISSFTTFDGHIWKLLVYAFLYDAGTCEDCAFSTRVILLVASLDLRDSALLYHTAEKFLQIRHIFMNIITLLELFPLLLLPQNPFLPSIREHLKYTYGLSPDLGTAYDKT